MATLTVILAVWSGQSVADARPNILWITCEDMGPHLGCYGDGYATTPNIDKFAKTALRYKKCWSNAPVCAPARTTLISGVHANSLGAEHMRSLVPFPKGLKLFPQYLRDAGYYCTNNQKEDYNVVKPGKVWDESSKNAHWRNRQPGQPFFAVFNFTSTHESQIRKRPHTLKHDPMKVRLPAYHPDAPEVRQDWAQYYDNIATMDGQFARTLGELDAAGLANDTIVFFFSDHGSGMPRNKRSACNSGLHVPLMVRIPEKFKHLAPKDYATGGVTDRLVSFVDFGPTMLSLAGAKPLSHLQGKAFMGKYEAEPNQFLFGYRGRMDERCDCVRAVTDGRFVLTTNYMHWLPHGQHVEYMFQTPTTRVWKKSFDEKRTNARQARFWSARAAEELFDLAADAEELDPLLPHADMASKLRRALRDWQSETLDLWQYPEAELHRQRGDESPYDFARKNADAIRQRAAKAELAGGSAAAGANAVDARFRDRDPVARYWEASRARPANGAPFPNPQHPGPQLTTLLADESPSVRIAAAEVLVKHGSEEQRNRGLATLLELAPVKTNGVHVSCEALNALSNLGEKARPGLEVIRQAADGVEKVEPRLRIGPERLVEQIVRDLSRS